MFIDQNVLVHMHAFAYGAFLAAVFTLWVARVSFNRRKQRGALYFMYWMLAISFWLTMAGFQYSQFQNTPESLSRNIFWAKMLYWGIVQIPFWYVLFAWEITGHHHLITRRSIIIQLIMPIITLILVWTNGSHHLIWTDFIYQEKYLAWDYAKGIGLYIVVVGYIYAALLYGSYFILRMAISNIRKYLGQSIFLLIGVSIPWIVNILYMFNFTQIGLDPTPMALSFSGLFMMIALFQFRLLDLVKVARDEVIEEMADGVLIVDSENTILDFNPAFQEMLGSKIPIHNGWNALDALSSYEELAAHLETQPSNKVVVLYTGLKGRKHEVTIAPLYKSNSAFSKALSARMVLIRDITMTSKAKELLSEKNAKLEEQLAQNELLRQQLQEAVIRDGLTGLYNRRFFEELAEKEMAKAIRNEKSLCILMMDIDHFKDFNDTYGHQVGDEVLRTFGEFLLTTSRESDLVCRYGGEEFVAILGNTTPEILLDRATSLLAEIRKLVVEYDGEQYRFTVSIGIGSYPDDGHSVEKVLKAADDRLYLAKRKGRDRICWAADDEK